MFPLCFDMTAQEQAVVDGFHDLYYDGPAGAAPVFVRTYWMGVECLKCPLDLWIYQEIIAETLPDLVVETGTYMGGSALFLAHVLDVVGRGEIISIDILDLPGRPVHPRIKYVTGSSSDPGLIRSLLDHRPEERRMIILDSDHTKGHVLSELHLLAPYLNPGGYLIVEDTNINGHPAYRSFGEGPFEAVAEFLQEDSSFVVDEAREKFLMTFNPRGFLKKTA